MHTFVWLNGRADHEMGCHDDLIFAALLAIMLLDKGKSIDFAKFMFTDERNMVSDVRSKIENLDDYMQKTNDKARVQYKYAKALGFGIDEQYILDYELLFGKKEQDQVVRRG
jgi:hypothetical protein